MFKKILKGVLFTVIIGWALAILVLAISQESQPNPSVGSGVNETIAVTR